MLSTVLLVYLPISYVCGTNAIVKYYTVLFALYGCHEVAMMVITTSYKMTRNANDNQPAVVLAVVYINI